MAGVGLGALARGLMYALARYPLWALPLPLLLRGRRGTWSSSTGSDVRFGAFWAPPLCRILLCVAGTCAGSGVRAFWINPTQQNYFGRCVTFQNNCSKIISTFWMTKKRRQQGPNNYCVLILFGDG